MCSPKKRCCNHLIEKISEYERHCKNIRKSNFEKLCFVTKKDVKDFENKKKCQRLITRA